MQAGELLGASSSAGFEEGEVGSRISAGKEASLASRHFHTVLKKADCT